MINKCKSKRDWKLLLFIFAVGRRGIVFGSQEHLTTLANEMIVNDFSEDHQNCTQIALPNQWEMLCSLYCSENCV